MMDRVHTRSGRRSDRPGVRQAHLNGRHQRAVDDRLGANPQCTHAFRFAFMPLLWICQLCGATVTDQEIGGPRSVLIARVRAIKRLAARS